MKWKNGNTRKNRKQKKPGRFDNINIPTNKTCCKFILHLIRFENDKGKKNQKVFSNVSGINQSQISIYLDFLKESGYIKQGKAFKVNFDKIIDDFWIFLQAKYEKRIDEEKNRYWEIKGNNKSKRDTWFPMMTAEEEIKMEFKKGKKKNMIKKFRRFYDKELADFEISFLEDKPIKLRETLHENLHKLIELDLSYFVQQFYYKNPNDLNSFTLNEIFERYVLECIYSIFNIVEMALQRNSRLMVDDMQRRLLNFHRICKIIMKVPEGARPFFTMCFQNLIIEKEANLTNK
jgi:hypothetical protein